MLKETQREIAKDSWAKNIEKFGLIWPDESIIRFANKSYPKGDRKQYKILELGCGSGRNSIAIAAEGFSVFAIDYNEQSVNMTLDRAQKFGVLVDAQQGDIKELPFPNEFMDGVIAWGLFFLFEVEDIKKALLESRRVLKDGGLNFANWRASDDFFYGRGKQIGNNTFMLDATNQPFGLSDTLYSFFKEKELRALYEECGFEVYNMERKEFWVNNLEVKNIHWHVWAKKKWTGE